MDERELEQRLRTAVEHAAPDPLDRILAACGPQAGTVLPFEAPKKTRRWAPLAVAAALVVMCCGAFGISSIPFNVFVDKKGDVVLAGTGLVEHKDLVEIFDKLLED